MHSMVVTDDTRNKMFSNIATPWDYSRSGLASHAPHSLHAQQPLDASMRHEAAKADLKEKKLRFDVRFV